MKRINLFFYYQQKKNYRRKIHQQSISVGDSVGKLITDGICVLRRRKNSVGKTVKSCSDLLVTGGASPLLEELGPASLVMAAKAAHPLVSLSKVEFSFVNGINQINHSTK